MQIGEPGFLIEFPAIGQPRGQVAFKRGRQVNQQLCEIKLRIDVMPATSCGEAGEDGGGTAAARVADEEAVFPIMPRFA